MNIGREGVRLKVLVAIASYGEKNLNCLQKVIGTYRAMAMDVDVVVTAEAPKTVDLGVPVRVGTPSRNPHSLPFAHKQVFAENVDRYDLFVYTEDDIEVSEESLRAFVQVSQVLDADEIAGYIRFEVAPSGERTLPDVHGRFHWNPASVRRRGEYVTAEFTNEHAGFYVLTNDQLRRALASGAYLPEPYEGRYEMLESGATDVYVNCGFRKTICVSHLEEFLIHHMPNRYAGKLGVPLSLFQEQVATLLEIERGRHPATTLCEVEPKGLERDWAKRYDEHPSAELLTLLPTQARTVLSVGCGSGVTERALQNEGATVTVFPLDSVVGAQMERHGLEVVYGTLEQCLRAVQGRQFDGVMITNLIHLLPNPSELLQHCAALLGPGGTLVVEGRNIDRLPVLIKRSVGSGRPRRIPRFSEGGIEMYRVNRVKKTIKRAGLQVQTLRWLDRHWPWPFTALARWFGRFAARTWILRAQTPAFKQP